VVLSYRFAPEQCRIYLKSMSYESDIHFLGCTLWPFMASWWTVQLELTRYSQERNELASSVTGIFTKQENYVEDLIESVASIINLT
jgi:hypothetical protein